MTVESFELFVDSGAYSAHNSGVSIDLQEYITYLQDNKDYIDVYANLDVIGDPEATLENQKIMEEAGLSPVPCFHMDEDLKQLQFYVEHCPDYIALGGMADERDTAKLTAWLDECFDIICNKDGVPKVKVHGFGITNIDLLWRYPFHSVDSTTWMKTGEFGSVYVPKLKDGKYDYREKPWIIEVSNVLLLTEKTGKYYWDKLDDELKSHCLKYFEEKGYKLGESKFKLVDENYMLARDERKEPHVDNDGKKGVEMFIEYGLSNHPYLRHEINAIFFLDLEKALNEHRSSDLSP